MNTVTAKEQVRELVERLEPPQLEAIARLLESMVNGASKLGVDIPAADAEEYRVAFDEAESRLQAEKSGAVIEGILLGLPNRIEAPKKRHRQDESEWIATHQEELNSHRGKWVVIEGSRLVAVDADYLTARNKAVDAGIKIPLILQVPENDLPFAGF